MNISALSTEYVRVPVLTTFNPTNDVVQFAFLVDGTQPSSGDWKAGSWETDTINGITTYYARCLIGPTGGTMTLVAGSYRIWLKITDNPEVPVRIAGTLIVS